MRRQSKRLGQRVRQRQKYAIRLLAAVAAAGCIIFIKTTTLFSLSDILKATASESQNAEVTNVKLVNDFGIPAPVLKKTNSSASAIHYYNVRQQASPAKN